MFGKYELHTVQGVQGYYNKEAIKKDYSLFTSHDFKEICHLSTQFHNLACYPADDLKGKMLKKVREMIRISFSMFIPDHKPNLRSLKYVFWHLRRLSCHFNVMESYVEEFDGISNYQRELETYAMCYRVIFEKLAKFFPEEV